MPPPIGHPQPAGGGHAGGGLWPDGPAHLVAGPRAAKATPTARSWPSPEASFMTDIRPRPPVLSRDPVRVQVAGSGLRAPVASRRSKKRRPWIAALGGLLLIGALAAIGVQEWDPPTLREASADYSRGAYEAARRKACAHLEARPMSRTAALIAARSLGRLGRPGEAEAYYRKAGPLGLELLHERAFTLIQAHLNDEAAEVYREILSGSPRDVLSLRRLAVTHILRSRWNDAIEVAGQLKSFPEGEVIGHTLAGVVYHDTDRPEEAVVELERVVALDPDLARMPLEPKEQFWVYLTQDLVKIGRLEQARPYLARALAERELPFYHDLLGRSSWLQGEIDDAERSWWRSIQINPGRPGPWLALGNLELQRGHPELAIERLSRAASLAPTSREPAYGLSQAYLRLGRREEADRYRAIADRSRTEKSKTGLDVPRGPTR
jgi:tetratricopeptide (TPR) repeat protein